MWFQSLTKEKGGKYAMMKRIQSLKPKVGKVFEAQEWAKEVKELGIKKYPKTVPEAYVKRFGDAMRIYFVNQFETFDEMQTTISEMLADEELQSVWEKSVELTAEGSLKINVFQEL
jgi:hypothetical protein